MHMLKSNVLEKTAIFFSVASLAVVFGIAIAGVTMVQRAFYKVSQKMPQQVACTEEAKQCPDGSYVGRTGPKCEFTACPVFADVESGSFTDISRACSTDSDCVVADSTATYDTCCPAGCGDSINYADEKWIAVNSEAMLQYVASKRGKICEATNCILPICPITFQVSDYKARCVQQVCKKVIDLSKEVSFEILASGKNGPEQREWQVVARTKQEGQELWKSMVFTEPSNQDAVLGSVDFSKSMLIGVGMGKMQNVRNSIYVDKVVDTPEVYTVYVKYIYPGVNQIGEEAPFEIIKLPKTGREVVFKIETVALP